MSGIGSVTSSAIDLLAVIRRQIQPAGGTGDALGVLADDSTTSASTAQSSAGTAAPTTGSGPSSFDPIVLNVIIQFQEQQSASTGTDTTGSAAADPATRGQQIFQKLDANGDGTINRSELESALGAKGVATSQSDAIFQKLDANDDSSVSQGEFAAAPHGHGHHPPPPVGADGAGAPDAASSSGTGETQSVTNPDGSTTTTITYSDGATVTLTTPANTSPDTSTASGSTTGSSKDAFGANMERLIETLVQLQAAFQPTGRTSQATSIVA